MRRYLAPLSILAVAAVLAVALAPAGVGAQAGKPRTLVWTAYDVGSAGYIQAASIGHAMSKREGVTLRVVPAGNDVARQAPIAAGRAHFGALGIASFLSQEGVQDFASTDWGPQPIRILGAAWGDFNTGNVAAAGDAGIKTVFDLKGKRIAWVVGAPALNSNMEAFLACANLTWNDVRKTEFPSWGASARAVIEGTADPIFVKDLQGRYCWSTPRKRGSSAGPSSARSPASTFTLTSASNIIVCSASACGATAPSHRRSSAGPRTRRTCSRSSVSPSRGSPSSTTARSTSWTTTGTARAHSPRMVRWRSFRHFHPMANGSPMSPIAVGIRTSSFAERMG